MWRKHKGNLDIPKNAKKSCTIRRGKVHFILAKIREFPTNRLGLLGCENVDVKRRVAKCDYRFGRSAGVP